MTEPAGEGPIRVPGTKKIFKRRRILLVLLSEIVVALMAVSSINVGLPSIGASLGASDADLQLLLSGYALAYGIVLVAAGRIGDLIGHSTMFVVGMVIFTLASLFCGLAVDPVMLNAFRILQGIGSGVASPQVNGMIVRYFTGAKRAAAFSYFGLTVSVAVSISPTITGLLIKVFGPNLGWRASFLWNVPIGIAAVLLAFAWLPFGTERARRLGLVKHQGRIDLDPLGMVLLGSAVISVMLPFLIKQGPYFLLLTTGALFGMAWVAWERHYAAIGRAPMVDLGLFRRRSFTHAVAISGTQFLASTSVFSVMALYLQSGLGASALAVGLLGVPNAIASATSSMWTGKRVLTRGRTIMVWSIGLFAFSLLACIAVGHFLIAGSSSIHYWPMAIPLIFTGLAVGAINSANQTLSQSDVPPPVAGTAGAVKQVAERTGTAIGNAMTTAVLFALVPSSWTLGFIGAFAVMFLISLVSMGLAIFDLCTLGDPAGVY